MSLGIRLAWTLAAILPTLFGAWVVYRADKNREPVSWVVAIYMFGAAMAGVSFGIVSLLAKVTSLSTLVGDGGEPGSVFFLFAVVAPLQEMLKVAGTWPAYHSRQFDEPFDGIVYASMASLGFAAVDTAILMFTHSSPFWFLRTMLALPAHWFFACGWGYALGMAGRGKGGQLFMRLWLGATLGHAFYMHLAYGRGPGVLVLLGPLLVGMAIVVFIAGRDLRSRGERVSVLPDSIERQFSRLSILSEAPTIESVREGLQRHGQPIMTRWIIYGALVTLGSMIVGLVGAIFLGRSLGVDFVLLDERDSSSAAALALLGSGILAAFPLSGFFVSRASGLPTLLETALATALAILVTLMFFGAAAPGALVFLAAFSPLAWGLACLGAWVGRVRAH